MKVNNELNDELNKLGERLTFLASEASEADGGEEDGEESSSEQEEDSQKKEEDKGEEVLLDRD